MKEHRTKHYYKNVAHLSEVDVYRVLSLFEVTDPCIQHALKKLLVPGGRVGGKDRSTDVREAIYSLQRWQEMQREDAVPPHPLQELAPVPAAVPSPDWERIPDRVAVRHRDGTVLIPGDPGFDEVLPLAKGWIDNSDAPDLV